MSENEDAAVALPPPAATTPTPQHAPSSKSAANDPDVVTRRVLLYEVLLEEYETHRPSGEGDSALTNKPERPDSMADAARIVAPPNVERELKRLERRGNTKRKKCNKIEDGEERAKALDKYNAWLVSRFFTLMAQAQSEEADTVFGNGTDKEKTGGKPVTKDEGRRVDYESLREEFAKNLELAWQEIPPEEQPSGTPKTYLDWALADEIYGVLDDHRERQRKTLPRARDEDEETRDNKINLLALAAWLKTFPPADDATLSSPPDEHDSVTR